MGKVLDQLRARLNAVPAVPPSDRLREAVERFWVSKQFETFRDAYLVCFGLGLSHRLGGCLLDDPERFQAVLVGIAPWRNQPRFFRRCYRGLMHSYFSDGSGKTPHAQAWLALRTYLHQQRAGLVDQSGSSPSPSWVEIVREHSTLFTADPCARYAQKVFDGDRSEVDSVCGALGIGRDSWFQRDLFLAQIHHAVRLDDSAFGQQVLRLLGMIAPNQVLRDQCLVQILDRYALLANPQLHRELRDTAVDWWRNPWLPSNAARWGGVTPKAREMVSQWLKQDLVQAFFNLIAQDGQKNEKARVNFWLRYVHVMDTVQFALGPTAQHSLGALEKKMAGLITPMQGNNGAAFVMTMGPLVMVEFASMGNALYGYDRRRVPFDLMKPVFTAKNSLNSLKHDSREVWLKHQDGWENQFDACLLGFGLQAKAGGKSRAGGR
ncbi:MAG: EH signature domain-containing protein [Leptothrix ochracea]|uniref:EH signature domain-containing protein n=1 Tax=Leptothrix ochracea TaxID=735331 RepID=UPI0034E215AC